MAVEDADFDDGARIPRRQAQRGISDIGRLLPEDGAEELFFRRHRAFALRSDLANEDIARANLGADVNDASLVEVAQRFFTDVRDVAGDFFRPKLGVAGGDFEFLDVDRGEDVVAHDALGDQDRVFVVVAVPRHERDDDVLAKSQFAHVGGRAIGDNFQLFNRVAHLHQRTLVNAGVLVRPLELAQAVDVDAGVADLEIGGGAHNDTLGIDLVDDTGAAGHDRGARVAGDNAFDAGADERRLGLKKRNSLTLHVRAHQSAVGVVILEERNERGRDRDKLLGRDVDEVNILARGESVFARLTGRHEVVDEVAVLVERRVGLGHGVAHFLGRRHILDFVRDLAADHFAIGGLDEAIFVDAGEGGQRVDQADVRAFRRFDRAHPAIVGRVHVAHLKARAFPRETARPEGREAPLVGDFRQRVGLVHELRQLRGAEEFAHRGRGRFGVDQVLRHDGVDLDRRHALLDRAFHAEQADAILVFHQLADRTDTAVAEVVDIVDLALAVAQLDQSLDAGDDVLVAEGAHGVGGVEIEAHVHLHAAHGRKIIALAVEEQGIEQGRSGVDGRRLARAHDTVDVHERGFAVHVLVGGHGVAHVGADIDVVDIKNRDRLDARIEQLFQRAADQGAIRIDLGGKLVTGLDIDRAIFFVDDVFGDVFANDMRERHEKLADLALFDQLLDGARGHFLAGLGDHFAGLGVDQVIGRAGAACALGEELGDPVLALFLELVFDGLVIGIHDAFLIHSERIKERRHRQLAATVDAREHKILGVKLEIQPGTAVGDDAAGEEELARRVGLAFVVIEEHARAAVHLGNDDALCSVDDEGAVGGHERHVTHEHVLLFDVLDRLGAGILIDIEYDEAKRDLQRGRIGQIALHAFFNVELGLFELVFHKLENGCLAEILDRKDRLEDTLDPFAVGGLGGVARPQEEVVGGFLNLDEVRHFKHFTDFTVIFAQAFLTEEGLSHVRRHLSILYWVHAVGLRHSARLRADEFRSIPGFRPTGSLPIRNLSKEGAAFAPC